MKLVKEYINFERGLDPKIAMGTGLSEWERNNHLIVSGMEKIAKKYNKKVELISNKDYDDDTLVCIKYNETSHIFMHYIESVLKNYEVGFVYHKYSRTTASISLGLKIVDYYLSINH